MLDKYIKINDRVIVSGQDGKTGMWYCKELPSDTPEETKTLIGKLNKIYNDYNKVTKKAFQTPKKEKIDVKGLK